MKGIGNAVLLVQRKEIRITPGSDMGYGRFVDLGFSQT